MRGMDGIAVFGTGHRPAKRSKDRLLVSISCGINDGRVLDFPSVSESGVKGFLLIYDVLPCDELDNEKIKISKHYLVDDFLLSDLKSFCEYALKAPLAWR